MVEALPCQRHPSETTRLRCSDCEIPICPKCMVVCEVGNKCPQCVNKTKSHLLQVSPIHFLRAAVSAVAVGYGFGYILPWFLGGWFWILALILFMAAARWLGDLLVGLSGRKMGSPLGWTAFTGIIAGGLLSPTGDSIQFYLFTLLEGGEAAESVDSILILYDVVLPLVLMVVLATLVRRTFLGK